MKNFLRTARSKLTKLDCTQLRALLEEATQEADFLQSAINSLSMGIIVISNDGSVRMSNRMAEIVCGRPIDRESCVSSLFEYGRLAYDLQYAVEQRKDFDFREYVLTVPRAVLSKGESRRTEQHSDMKFVRCALLPFVERKTSARSGPARGAVTGSVICIEDISDEREAQQREYRDKSFSSMRHVTAGIAHELKNPLGAISVHLQLLRRKLRQLEKSENTESPAPSKKSSKKTAAASTGSGAKENSRGASGTADIGKMLSYVQVIEDEIQTMDNVVSVFLNDFKIRPADLQPRDINDVLETLFLLIAPDLKKHRIKLEKRLCKKLPKVLVSAHAMTHAVLNVVKNAMDAMAGGGVLTVATDCENSKVRVVVSDTGGGVPDQVQQHIFDPYFTTKNTGNGIGLTVAYKLAQLHGGDVVLDPQHKGGASFVITLPAYADEQRLLTGRPRAEDRMRYEI